MNKNHNKYNKKIMNNNKLNIEHKMMLQIISKK
jgi:hypothetical protein